MALLDLVPPAIDLVAHHRRFVDEQRALGRQSEQRLIRSRHRREKLPPRKDAHAAGRGQLGSQLFIPVRLLACAFQPRICAFQFASRAFQLHPLPIEPPVNRGQQPLCHRGLGERQKLRLVQPALRALRLRIELADGLDLVAEEFDAHRPVGLRRIHVQNPAPPRKLPRHLHQIHLRVAHAGQVSGEHLDVHLFAALQRHRQPGVVVAVKQLQRRRLHRRNQNRHRSGRQLPQSRRPLLLHIRMRRKIFKREHIVGRQPHQRRRVHRAGQLAPGAQHRLQRLGGLVVGHHHDHRLLGSARHQRKVKRTRRRRQSRDTPPPRTQAQMPSYALKSRRVLQLREDFADKRENHVVSV